MRVRFRTTIVAAVVLAVAGVLSACQLPESYVALGDSYTSGPGILPQGTAVPGCLRSDANYPHLVAPRVNQPAFRDVSCSGAKTVDMTSPQDVSPNPDNPPQFNGLDANTRIVTIGIGGNDIGFVEIAKQCVQSAPDNPLGSPCRAYYNRNGVDEIATRLATLAQRLELVLDGIDARSPKAKVFVVGYPAILPEADDPLGYTPCTPVLPVATGDYPWLRDGVEKRLNAVINFVATGHGEVYVDTYTSSIGHDACKPPGVRWVEPVVPAADAAPVHPNRFGMENTARAVLASMQAHGVTVR